MLEQVELAISILEEPAEILKYLHLCISIPILPKFHKYILKDLEAYNAKALILHEIIEYPEYDVKPHDVSGIVLVYEDGSDILFFGFCGVYDHDESKIEYLVENLVDYAREKGYKKVRGPINIPTVIYGWGFMVEGSNKELFIGCPANPPIYQKVFKKKGFEVLFQEDRYDMGCVVVKPYNLPKLIDMGIRNSAEYQENKRKLEKDIKTGKYIGKPVPVGDYLYDYYNYPKEKMMEIKSEFASLYGKYMPDSAKITPKAEHNVENIINFIFEFGGNWMIWVVRDKKTGEMVANGYVIPNIFNKDKNDRLNSVSFHAWVVHPEHRRRYIAMIMYGFTSMQGYKGKEGKNKWYIHNGSWPVGAENEANREAARKMGGNKDRSHLILELYLN